MEYEAKRAIYVGKNQYGMSYGMTGVGAVKRSRCIFSPDGTHVFQWMPARDVYFPSTEPTRHCPKPK